MTRPTSNDFLRELEQARKHLEIAAGMFPHVDWPAWFIWIPVYKNVVRAMLKVSSILDYTDRRLNRKKYT